MKKDINRLFFLYVEDDPRSRKVMTLIMDKVMRHPHYAIFSDSSDFMKKLINLPQQPDVIMLDIHMKPFDGITLLKMLRADPQYANVRIIALTASVMNEEIQQLRAQGFDGAIGKPIDLSTFPSLLQWVVDGEPVWSVT